MSANNGKNGSNGHGHRDDELALSESQLELLRHALIEHGKRLGELEERMEKTLDDLLKVKEIIGRTHSRMRKIAEKLNIDLDKL